jgi:hypothetical protein
VELSENSGLSFVRWSQREDLTHNWVAATNLRPGVVLTQALITKKSDLLANGKSLVGLSLKDGQFPDGLHAGQTVAAYRVGNDAAKSGSGSDGGAGGNSGLGPDANLISDHLVVQTNPSSSSGFSSGDTLVTVVADSADAGQLTIAASADEVALVLVSGKN